MGVATEFQWDWLAHVASVQNFYYARVSFAGTVFAVEYIPEDDELTLCFRLPCCRREDWELVPDRGRGYAACSRCERHFDLPREQSILTVWSSHQPNVEDAQFQVEAMELFLTHWGKHPLDAAFLAHEFLAHLNALRGNLKIPDLAPITNADFIQLVEVEV